MTDAIVPTAHPIRFCRSEDGVRIAYALAGRGPALVKTPNWMNHVELDPRSCVWSGWIDQMTRRVRLLRYDARACGLSDREVAVADLPAYQRDLEAVVDAAGLDRFALHGASQGAVVAIEYAARHPERVSHLILHGAYLQGVLRRNAPPQEIEEAHLMLKMVELGWGRENSAFRQVFAGQFIPDSSPQQQSAFDEIQRQTISAGAAARLLATFYEADVSAHAARVQCPTLVFHSRQDARVPFEEGMRVASAIPGAEFVPLDSRNHIVLPHQPASRRILELFDDFMRRHPDAQAAPQRVPGLPGLTAQESRLLDLLASGINNAQIAAALGIREKTVRNHINHIFSKLAVDDRAQAIVLAREAGLGRR